MQAARLIIVITYTITKIGMVKTFTSLVQTVGMIFALLLIRSSKVNRFKSKPIKALRAAILSGELARDNDWWKLSLLQKLQVSRTPIREAIGLLSMSLATIDPNGALRVATIQNRYRAVV